ncbi:hypothetical protein [Paucihalobacter sp.]|uniref:hypothetical protein n=1 Tax=Paucihalobacter sp. TaxID=2850405 RepID=UPI002FE3D55D
MKHLNCALYGHKLVITKHVTNHVKEYKCKNCSQQATTSSNGKIILLNDKRKEINQTLERIHQIRKSKKVSLSS